MSDESWIEDHRYAVTFASILVALPMGLATIIYIYDGWITAGTLTASAATFWVALILTGVFLVGVGEIHRSRKTNKEKSE